MKTWFLYALTIFFLFNISLSVHAEQNKAAKQRVNYKLPNKYQKKASSNKTGKSKSYNYTKPNYSKQKNSPTKQRVNYKLPNKYQKKASPNKTGKSKSYNYKKPNYSKQKNSPTKKRVNYKLPNKYQQKALKGKPGYTKKYNNRKYKYNPSQRKIRKRQSVYRSHPQRMYNRSKTARYNHHPRKAYRYYSKPRLYLGFNLSFPYYRNYLWSYWKSPYYYRNQSCYANNFRSAYYPYSPLNKSGYYRYASGYATNCYNNYCTVHNNYAVHEDEKIESNYNNPQGSITEQLPSRAKKLIIDGKVYYLYRDEVYQKIESEDGFIYEVVGYVSQETS